MAMESTDRTASPPAIVGLIGGALLIVGSFLTWVTLSFNLDAFAKVLSDAAGVQISASDLASQGLGGSTSSSGIKNDGKLTLVAGVIVVVCAILLIAVANARKAAAIVMIIAGALGGLVAGYNLLTKNSQIDKALADAGAQLQGLGISVDVFRPVLNVQWGIGIYLCLVGGIVAVVGGVMARRSPAGVGTAQPATAGASAGFGPPASTTMGSTSAMPSAPPATMPDPVAPEPSRAPETPQPTAPPASTEPGGTTPPAEPRSEPPA
jgi:hypothetical protein